ncbi:MAG: protein-export chaperone SecB [Propionivibrio sp.]|uniref:protein-export chaperone SecB n=1 Tax=Propionivibrio sp. TaxID=2212460 RepID=UPI001A5CA534|nr:protein-export chaperone SecB [Propionivibrio sp.]MBL8416466.1 protein-export chaperone SecB [Propionivibrio sp.]
MTQQEAPSFAIEKLYVKDLSLEVPSAPEIFLERESPEVNIQLQTAVKGLGDGAYEVTLTVTVTAKLVEKTVFLVEVGQAGIFRVKNVPEDNLEPLLSIACPNILFPYARELVSDSITRAGFAPVLLQPVNFEALYAARAQQQAAASATESVAEGTPTIQ